jgi:hypothetical protein
MTLAQLMSFQSLSTLAYINNLVARNPVKKSTSACWHRVHLSMLAISCDKKGGLQLFCHSSGRPDRLSELVVLPEAGNIVAT